MLLDLRHAVLVNEPPVSGFYGLPARSADDGRRFSEEHVGLPEA
jgi:hypothetical protein